jgi:hypothetical protein
MDSTVKALIMGLTITVVGGVIVRVIENGYVRAHPVAPNIETVGRSRRPSAPETAIKTGSLQLAQGRSFSFALGTQVDGPSDLLLGGGGLLSAPGILDLGPVSIDSVTAVPKAPISLARRLSLGPYRKSGVAAQVGHTYALHLNNNGGPYAVIQVTRVEQGQAQGSVSSILGVYKFQANGAPVF